MKSQDKILEEYTKKSDELLKKMYQILYSAQRKADETAYRAIIDKLQKSL